MKSLFLAFSACLLYTTSAQIASCDVFQVKCQTLLRKLTLILKRLSFFSSKSFKDNTIQEMQ